ncbi:MAG TPA: ATP-binding protein [Clostridiales bacterium]|nr:ATP-binding protein [Clostridiales bacterium]
MTKLIFVIGATATGKTYFIEQNFTGKDVDILNVYDYQQRAYNEAGFAEYIPLGAQFRCLLRANQMLLDDIIDKLSHGRDVVVEHILYKAKRRIAYIDQIRKKADVTIAMYVMQPSNLQWESNIKKRKLKGNFKSYKNEEKEFEFPNVAEGIDTVYEVVDGKIILRMDTPRLEILEKARGELAQEAERLRLEDEKEKKRKELLDSMKECPFWHYCEVCGKKEFITAKEAFDNGWDYPPDIGHFGLLGPRTCGSCQLKDTLYWKIMQNNGLPIVIEGKLTPEELVTWRRIKGEPESLLADEE